MRTYRRALITHYHLPLATCALATLLALAAAILPARADDEPVPREVQYAVDRGLEWLAKAQSSNGTWGGPASGGGNSAVAASTSLAVMAFMARGHCPGQGPYGDNLNRAVDAIIALQSRDGVIAQSSLSETMYDHGISTVALCEAYGMLDDRRQAAAKTAIAKAVSVILDAQAIPKRSGSQPGEPGDQGGWRYTPRATDSDTSVSGWQLMALRGASNIGANIPAKNIDAGIAYIQDRGYIAAEGGGFCYMGKQRPNVALTGTGILALSLMGKPDDPRVRAGGDYLLRNFDPVHPSGAYYYYTIYYVSQAAWQLGGNYWTVLNQRLSTDVRARQKPDGHWTGGEANDHYCTAMAVLALTVPYRYLPIYQR
jgi:hypothetical protein